MLKNLQRKTDKFVITARELSSRGTSFIIVMLGVLLQASHTTFLMYSVAAFDSWFVRGLVSFGVGIFITGALAVFTLKHDGSKESKLRINIFFYFEVFTNIFYYWNSIIFDGGFDNATTQDWLYIIIAMPFAFIMPYAIKQFAGVIKSDEKLEFGSIEDENDVIDREEFSQLLETKIETITEDIKNEIVKDIEVLKKERKELIDLKEEVNKKVDGFNPKDYLKKGTKVKITLDGKESYVTLK